MAKRCQAGAVPVLYPVGECQGAKVPAQGQGLPTGKGVGMGLSVTALCLRGTSWCPEWG